MCHLHRALPGDRVRYEEGMNWVIDRAHDDLMALLKWRRGCGDVLQRFSLPYLTKVRPETTTAMARIIGPDVGEIHALPFGVNVLCGTLWLV